MFHERTERLEFLASLQGPDVEVQGRRADDLDCPQWFIPLGVELEANFQFCPRVATIRVQMRRGEKDLGARLEQLTGIAMKDVGVSSHLVHRPKTSILHRFTVRPDRHNDQVVD